MAELGRGLGLEHVPAAVHIVLLEIKRDQTAIITAGEVFASVRTDSFDLSDDPSLVGNDRSVPNRLLLCLGFLIVPFGEQLHNSGSPLLPLSISHLRQRHLQPDMPTFVDEIILAVLNITQNQSIALSLVFLRLK